MLDGGKPFIEVGALSQTKGAFGEAKRRRALFVEPLQPLGGAGIELGEGKDGVDKAEALGGRGIDAVAGQQELEAFAGSELA